MGSVGEAPWQWPRRDLSRAGHEGLKRVAGLEGSGLDAGHWSSPPEAPKGWRQTPEQIAVRLLRSHLSLSRMIHRARARAHWSVLRRLSRGERAEPPNSDPEKRVASSPAEFPANREKCREIPAFRPIFGKTVSKSPTIRAAPGKFPTRANRELIGRIRELKFPVRPKTGISRAPDAPPGRRFPRASAAGAGQSRATTGRGAGCGSPISQMRPRRRSFEASARRDEAATPAPPRQACVAGTQCRPPTAIEPRLR